MPIMRWPESTKRPAPIAVTMGEPAGIGGEITLKAWQARRGSGPAFFVIDDPGRLRSVADKLGLEVPIQVIAHASEAIAFFSQCLPILPLPMRIEARLGSPDPGTAPAVLASIESAVALVQN